MMLKRISLTIQVLLCCTTFAEPLPLLRAPTASPNEFEAYVQGQSEFIPLSEWLVRHRVDAKWPKEVQRRLLLAQTEFLGGSLPRARELFQELLQLSPDQDWRAKERKIFAYAALRLAQLSRDEDSRRLFAQDAARWGATGLDVNQFPLPIWRLYQEELTRQTVDRLDLHLWQPLARYLLVDGRPYILGPNTEFEIDNESHRFTLIYDHAAVQTVNSTWEGLKLWNPKISPSTSGNCQSPIWLDPNLPAQTSLYFSNDCVVAKEKLNVRPVPAPSPLALNEISQPIPSATMTQQRSPWLWVGLGAAILAFVVVSNQPRSQSASPSTTVGF